MRLITWNAGHGQFSKKAPLIEQLGADIAVIQDIAQPQTPQPGVCWFGTNRHQGVAVLARRPYAVSRLPKVPDAPKYFLPFAVQGPFSFTLFAVWTMGSQELQYVRAITAAVDLYGHVFESGPVVVMGDFNSKAVRTGKYPVRLDQSAMVTKLAGVNIESAFHSHRGVAHGEEQEHTFFLDRNPDKGYHSDYCFMPADWVQRIKHVDVGSHAAWCKASDHVPLLVEIDLLRKVLSS